MIILETGRLRLRHLTADDERFVLQLLNEPSFIENIGDRGVRTLEEAQAFILNRYVASYVQYGFGLYLIEVKESGAAIGICGLVKRDALEHPDIGYALLPEFAGQGYAVEAAQGTVEYARTMLGMHRLLAVVNSDNFSSIRLLEKLGFGYERMVKLSDNEPEVKLFALEMH